MKLHALALALPLAAAARLAPRGEFVSYSGYKVVHVERRSDGPDVLDTLSGLNTVDLSHEQTGHVDLAIAPEDFDAFKALGVRHDVVHEDLGAELAREGALTPYAGRDEACRAGLPHVDWFNSYHPYDDHLEFARDLHLAFPDNSKLFTIGKSYEGRDISGIHLWGAGGPGSRPAVYWHATVHAREWIATMVGVPGEDTLLLTRAHAHAHVP